jgi:hypothetical protein
MMISLFTGFFSKNFLYIFLYLNFAERMFIVRDKNDPERT